MKSRRRDYFVKKWLQTRLVLAYLAVLLVGAAGLAWGIYDRTRQVLRYEMFKGHSTTFSTWEALQPYIVKTNVAVAVTVVAVAVAITLAVAWQFSRSARVLIANVRSAMAGGNPESWPPAPGIREINQLQGMVAGGVCSHREYVGELRSRCLSLKDELARIRTEKEAGPEGADAARIRKAHVDYVKIRNLYRHFTLE